MMHIYHVVADAMERLGLQTVTREERRESHGRRAQDSGWQFLIDHAILTLLEVAVAALVLAFVAGR